MSTSTATAAVNLSAAGCPPASLGVTSFGSQPIGTSVATSADCSITFGSNTGSSMLKVYQQDGAGRAMYRPVTGTLDQQFDGDALTMFGYPGNGTVITGLSPYDDKINDMAMQPDGKIVVAGATKTNSTTNDCFINRYNADATLDTSFNGTGKLVLDLGLGSGDFCDAVAVQADGKIVAMGIEVKQDTGQTAARTNDMVLVRLNVDGTMDLSFDGDATNPRAPGNGIVILDLGAGDTAWSGTIQPDGKIIGAGVSGTSPSDDFAAARVTAATGTLDTGPTGFNSTGVVKTAVGARQDEAYSIAIQADGKIILGGFSTVGTNPGNYQKEFALVRYNADGSIDATFDGTSGMPTTYPGNGVVTTSFGAGNDALYGLAIQPADQKIIAVGYSSTLTAMGIARYNTDGSLDTSFNTTGTLTYDWGLSAGEIAYAATVQPDGKILIAGGVGNTATGNDDFGAVRLNDDGSLDTTFNTTGTLKIDLRNGNDEALAMVAAPDGHVVLGGFATRGSQKELGLVRLDTETIPDFSPGINDWTIGAGLFGACLRSVSGTGVVAGTTNQAWPIDANNDCTTANADPWRMIPPTAATTTPSTAKVAASTTSGTTNAVANLRFGLRTRAGQGLGTYLAPITFDAYDPNV